MAKTGNAIVSFLNDLEKQKKLPKQLHSS